MLTDQFDQAIFGPDSRVEHSGLGGGDQVMHIDVCHCTRIAQKPVADDFVDGHRAKGAGPRV